MVGQVGLEPTIPKATHFECGAYTNSATAPYPYYTLSTRDLHVQHPRGELDGECHELGVCVARSNIDINIKPRLFEIVDKIGNIGECKFELSHNDTTGTIGTWSISRPRV